MKKLFIALIIGTSASTGIFMQIGDYWMFGKRYDTYSVAVDSNGRCVKYSGKEEKCSLRDFSRILHDKK